ncbi:hypothetical protein [Actinotalea solisilvae]|uniref:hypothetical protein n=1 Tax=Actinotalea solisilvae TaxID=2072922 RepID=UPI0018F200F0|nr:hypothetical protein [Actinotalea solisilvae]
MDDDARTGTPATPRALPRAAAVALWLLAALVAGGVAWWAVAAVGGESGADGRVLTQHEVAAALAEASAAPTQPPATPTPTPSSTPTASPTPGSTTPPATAPVVRVWDVSGGQVAAQCDGSAIALVYATPLDGWTVEVDGAGPDQVDVELRQGELETKLRATCVDGVPTQTVESDDDHDD